MTMTHQPIVFHGTPAEGSDLIAAISHNCECQSGPMGVIVEKCGAHKLLVESQRWIDHLVFLRRLGNLKLEWEKKWPDL